MLLRSARVARQDQRLAVYVAAFSKGCETGSTSCCLCCSVQQGLRDRISILLFMLLRSARDARQDQHLAVYVVAFSKGCETGSMSCCLCCCVQQGLRDRINILLFMLLRSARVAREDQHSAVYVAVFSKG